MNYFNDSIKFVLNKYPQFKNKYIKYGTALACLATYPIKELMLHVMYIQDLDPNMNLAAKFSSEIKNAFDKVDDFAYEKDFDVKDPALYKNLSDLKETLSKDIHYTKLIANCVDDLDLAYRQDKNNTPKDNSYYIKCINDGIRSLKNLGPEERKVLGVKLNHLKNGLFNQEQLESVEEDLINEVDSVETSSDSIEKEDISVLEPNVNDKAMEHRKYCKRKCRKKY